MIDSETGICLFALSSTDQAGIGSLGILGCMDCALLEYGVLVTLEPPYTRRRGALISYIKHF